MVLPEWVRGGVPRDGAVRLVLALAVLLLLLLVAGLCGSGGGATNDMFRSYERTPPFPSPLLQADNAPSAPTT